MADYDPKSIPILDDVIEKEKNADIDETSSPLFSAKPAVIAEDNLDLFTEKSKAVAKITPPQTVVIDKDVESALEEIESALVDYDADTEENGTEDDEQPIELELKTAQPPPSIEAIVEDITKQLIPDLEQQLRFLIQQALEDRLPDTLINKLASNKKKSD